MRTLEKTTRNQAKQNAKFDFVTIDKRLNELKELELKLLAELEKLK